MSHILDVIKISISHFKGKPIGKKAILVVAIFSLLISATVLAILIPYLNGNSVDDFNPLQELIDDSFISLEKWLTSDGTKAADKEKENVKDFLANVKDMIKPVMISVLTVSSVYAFASILLVIGSLNTKIRGLMVPYIILHPLISINVVTVSLFLNLTFAILLYPGWKILMIYAFLFFTIPFAPSFSYDGGQIFYLVQLICLVLNCNFVAMLSFLATFYAPVPFTWSFLVAKRTFVDLGKTSGSQKAEKE